MRYYFFILLLLTIHISSAQEIHTTLKSKQLLKADRFIGVDELENIFYLHGNTLYKQNNKETLSYSNVKLGKIHSVSFHNPFKIVLFYKDFNSVIILDNKLNELTDTIDFTKQSLFNQIQFVSPSSENNLWLLGDDNKIRLYDFQKNLIKLETQAINFYHNDFNPVSIKSSYKYIWVFSKTGIIQCNEYGSFIKYSTLEKFDSAFPYQNGFIYLNNNNLYYLDNNKQYTVSIEPNISLKDIYINNTSIYNFDGTYLYQYNIL